MSREANTQRAKVGTLVCDDDDDNGDAIISSRGEQHASDYSISAFSIITLACGTLTLLDVDGIQFLLKGQVHHRERELKFLRKKNRNLSISFLQNLDLASSIKELILDRVCFGTSPRGLTKETVLSRNKKVPLTNIYF